jgi:hypothetical protein
MGYGVLDFRRRRASGFGGSFPASLFASGEQGAWYDPSDLSTLFQDSAGTTPVTTAGQPVGLMLDKSGRGNHATQTTASKRPTYQSAAGLHWLAFNGLDDAMITGTITPGVDKAQMFVGVRKISDAATSCILETGTGSGSLSLFAPIAAGVPNYYFVSRGTTARDVTRTPFAAPNSAVLTAIGDISGDVSRLRVNGTVGEDLGDQGTGNYAAKTIEIGARNQTSLFFNGNIYGLITRFGPNLTDAQIADTETYMAARTGVAL